MVRENNINSEISIDEAVRDAISKMRGRNDKKALYEIHTTLISLLWMMRSNT